MHEQEDVTEEGRAWEASRAAHFRQLLSAAPDAPDVRVETSFKCYRMGAWGDVCVYHGLCLGGEEWLFLNQERGRTLAPINGVRDMLEGYLIPSKAVPSLQKQVIPYNSGVCLCVCVLLNVVQCRRSCRNLRLT